MKLFGYSWLIEQFGLPKHPLAVSSRLGSRWREMRHANGSVEREYSAQYTPDESVLGHLEFALKYEGVNLAVLWDVFRVCGPDPIKDAVRAKPTSKFSKMLGFYFETLTGKVLNPDLLIGGNYVPALDSKEYYVSPNPKRNPRWRVLDNLLGDHRYCPILRKTEALKDALEAPLQDELSGLMRDFPPEVFTRANDFLYLKETRSTYEIEREAMPKADRAQRFVALLKQAGEGDLESLLTEGELTLRQNLIVDPRYAAIGFRRDQNYVGEQRPDYSQRIHYACPPPQWVAEMMTGLAASSSRMAGLPPLVRSAALAFGFVFIHPFEDGNGRLHRFLIHDILHRDGFLQLGIMLPISATMLRHMAEYDGALKSYSAPLMAGMLSYDLDNEGRMTILNPEAVHGYYRFPDLTAQAEYLTQTVAITIREDIAEELRFLRNYDAARLAVREIVDIPNRKLDLLLSFLHQNAGKLAKAKRGQYAEITDEELSNIESAFSEAFG